MVDVRFDTNHRLIKGQLRINPRQGFVYQKSLQQRNEPVADIHGEKDKSEQSEVDKLMQHLHEALGKGVPVEGRNWSWISDMTFELMALKKWEL